jgi:hypothetical protein
MHTFNLTRDDLLLLQHLLEGKRRLKMTGGGNDGLGRFTLTLQLDGAPFTLRGHAAEALLVMWQPDDQCVEKEEP